MCPRKIQQGSLKKKAAPIPGRNLKAKPKKASGGSGKASRGPKGRY
jgi:hypothetical protein